jgi:nondiscriminating glutamyl-tRNA synthetase
MTRLRFAPSPTGFLHIGGLRTALYCKLFAQRHGGQFILRIEDTDQKRLVEGAVENLIRTLDWAGITPDEGPYLAPDGQVEERGAVGPYTQSKRLPLYRRHADELLAAGHAYRCFCSAERLEEVRRTKQLMKQPEMYDRLCRGLDRDESAKRAEAGEAHVIRFKMPLEGETRVADLVRGTVVFDNALIDDQVIVKTDGFPTYHLAVVVDDHAMGITHVFRGEEWLPSTPKHLALYAAFGWEPPQFAHLPLLLNPDRSKLSKRQGDVAVEDFRDQGYLRDALVNFIALLGWNPTSDREVYSVEELAALFDITKVNKGGAVFNREKLDWFNREYLRAMAPEALVELATPFYLKAGVLRQTGAGLATAAGDAVSADYLARVVSLEQVRLTTLAEFPEATGYLFDERYPLAAEALVWKKSDGATALRALVGVHSLIERADAARLDSPAAVEGLLKEFIAAEGLGNGEVLWPTRVALCGRERSPSPFELVWALGKDRTLARLKRGADLLS